MLKGLGNIADMAKMMKSAQEMQARVVELQRDLDHITLTGESGGGLVTVRCTGKGNITGIDLSPSILHTSAQDQAQSLILEAIKDAQARAQAHSKSELAKIAQSLGLPPDLELPF
jgi:DNA-binding YbaB/EbfC family protein